MEGELKLMRLLLILGLASAVIVLVVGLLVPRC